MITIIKKILSVSQLFKGDKGEWSSKRFVGIIGAIILFCTLIFNAKSEYEITLSADLIKSIEWIVILSLGFTSVDKYTNNK